MKVIATGKVTSGIINYEQVDPSYIDQLVAIECEQIERSEIGTDVY